MHVIAFNVSELNELLKRDLEGIDDAYFDITGHYPQHNTEELLWFWHRIHLDKLQCVLFKERFEMELSWVDRDLLGLLQRMHPAFASLLWRMTRWGGQPVRVLELEYFTLTARSLYLHYETESVRRLKGEFCERYPTHRFNGTEPLSRYSLFH